MPSNNTPCCANCFFGKPDIILMHRHWCWYDIPSQHHPSTFVCENFKPWSDTNV